MQAEQPTDVEKEHEEQQEQRTRIQDVLVQQSETVDTRIEQAVATKASTGQQTQTGIQQVSQPAMVLL